MILVTRPAPDFTATAVLHDGKIIKNFNFKKYIQGNPAMLFFWPMDFTFVCPSELISCNKRYSKFQKRNVKVVGVSLDSEFVHYAWRQIPTNKGGVGNLQFPMIADLKREIIMSYGIEHPDLGVALRGSFLIDQTGIVRHQIVNDLPLGRNFDEMIRMIDAMQFHEEHGLVCPAQWDTKKAGIEPSTQGIAEFLSKNVDEL
ncbi:peroxiredoxin C [Blochmannia endosymbiont of Camponotus (Colobopsis) obliquus]|uniref:peroxiredoxin C n=1 Tax=Blochmannia endosymbiont of Camponotus (Colobopsis) obliquus TaxID=1505597 RepID=UPI00061A8051|nr:peroxiredoxin C [Blochmannia endosymbiont of Camponotus (Colobopsis) obliquus]AKC60397.1 Alkyl hydroperoxide reductase subunit C [Blochmannia endosymbiont of Camponotus (Colobopsis) obliquus]